MTVPNLEISSTDLRERAADRPPARLPGARGGGALFAGPGSVRYRRMTTAPPVPRGNRPAPHAGTGERQRRRRERRRLGRQQMLVVLLMMLALIVTVAVLAQQWLATGAASGGKSGAPPIGTGILSLHEMRRKSNMTQGSRQ